MNRRFLISGYYGYNNAGDELILLSLIRSLRKYFSDSTITVLSGKPSKTSSEFNVNSILRNNIFSIIINMIRCSALISGGGGLLQDRTSKKSLWYYLGIILLARLFRKPVILYAQGIGPINDPFNRFLMKFTLKGLKCIITRDIESAKLLEILGINSSAIKTTTDPVFGIPKGNKDKGYIAMKNILRHSKTATGKNRSLDISKKNFIFILRHTSPYRNIIDMIKSPVSTTEIHDTLVEVCSSLLMKDFNIIFIPFQPSRDLKIIHKINKEINNAGIIIPDYKITDLRDIISTAHIVFSMRLHGIILSAINHVPFISLGIDPKIAYFSKELGEKPLTFLEFNIQTVLTKIEDIEKKREDIVERLKTKSEQLKEKEKENLKYLLSFCGS